nr:amidase family protein [Xylophilus sp.]
MPRPRWPRRARATRRAAGQAPSLLAGLPVSVKDLFNVQGQVTTAGSAVLVGNVPAAADAPVVARLRAAGAVLLGRTNLSEFAFSGLGLNPHRGTRIAAGRASARPPRWRSAWPRPHWDRHRRLGAHPVDLLRTDRLQADGAARSSTPC